MFPGVRLSSMPSMTTTNRSVVVFRPYVDARVLSLQKMLDESSFACGTQLTVNLEKLTELAAQSIQCSRAVPVEYWPKSSTEGLAWKSLSLR